MASTIGVILTTSIAAGLLHGHEIVGSLRRYPEDAEETGGLIDLPTDSLCSTICEQVQALLPAAGKLEAIGIALPGIIRNGIVEDSPNLAQLKGARIYDLVSASLKGRGILANLSILNDADAVAAGIAATRGQLDRVTRVWTLGNGIGFGRYPLMEGVWEGGHTVISLDPKEKFCGCGGVGHMEGIMGNRAMRLRFLDMEPEEIFANAKTGDQRCVDFVHRWHRALAAATANSIHMDGPGRFYFTGLNTRFLEINLLKEYLWEMVKMSPLQSYSLEMIDQTSELSIIGAAAAASVAGKA
jgi:predicted NBD/HSP70 family sugar kinase